MSITITEPKEGNNNIKKTIADYIKQAVLQGILIALGMTIIVFNVMGYKELLNEPSLGIITPFGFLIGLSELAVLIWMSCVIKNLPTVSWVLKYSIIPVFILFWILCFTGINSYLKKYAYGEVKELQAAKIKYDNNKVQLKSIDEQILVIQSALNDAQKERILDNDRISQLQFEANQISTKMSTRRLGSLICDRNVDCKAAVADYKQQIDSIQHQINQLQGSVADKQRFVSTYEADLTEMSKNKRELNKDNRDLVNLHAHSEGAFSVKKQTYEDIVVGIFNFFGFKSPEDPYSTFIGFISLIIYPVYFLLNLYINLGSEANRAMAESKRKNPNYRKLLKYLRVWALRRKKTRNIVVIKEVEKIVEKEVPVYVDRVKKVSEPVFINEPEIYFHERLIPVPENISAQELKELMENRVEHNEGIKNERK